MAVPAKSKAQQKAAGAALAAKRGKEPSSKLKGASRSMASSMSEAELEELASTTRRKLPAHVSGKSSKQPGEKRSTSRRDGK